MQKQEKCETGSEQRRHQRVVARQVLGDITDGQTVLRGRIIDFSRNGCRIQGDFKGLQDDMHTCSAVISTSKNHFKLLVTPRWTKKIAGGEVEIGFKIVDSEWDWVEFSEKGIDAFA